MNLRLSPKWFTLADERTLEYLGQEGRASPSIIANDDRVLFVRQYINKRLVKLTNAGITARVGRGFYELSDVGEGYLAGDVDLREMPDPDEED